MLTLVFPFTDRCEMQFMIHSTDCGIRQVPPGHCWVLGDNIPQSRDSRLFGPLPMALIRGKVVGRVDSWWTLLVPHRLDGLSDPDVEDDID